MRCFIAVMFDEPFLDGMAQIQKIAKRLSHGHGRFKSVGNIHMTLRFLGEIEEKDIGRISDAMSAAAATHAAAVLVPDRVGAFMARGRVRTLYVGLKDGSPELAALASSISEKLRAAGFEDDTKPFVPHITICQDMRPGFRFEEMDRAVDWRKVPHMRYDRISLVKSSQVDGRRVYETICEVPLLKG